MDETSKTAKVKSLYKAVKLLDFFIGDVKELGITELSEKSGLLKSTVHNIMSTYELCGIIERNNQTNKYHLGIKILELSNQLYRNNDIRQVLHPLMQQIVDKVGENMYLGRLYENEVIYLDAVFPKDNASGRNMIGIRAKAYCTGIGKVMLAYESEAVIDEVIYLGLQAFTEATITDGTQLKQELANIRKKGYAIDNMEHEYGVRCIAVPIRNYEGKVVAACSLSGPSLRFTDEKMNEYSQLIIPIMNSASHLIQ